MRPLRARQGNFYGKRNSLMHRMRPRDPSALPGLQARPDLVARGTEARAQVFRRQRRIAGRDRKSVVSGKSVSVRVDLGGRRIIKKKKNITYKNTPKCKEK